MPGAVTESLDPASLEFSLRLLTRWEGDWYLHLHENSSTRHIPIYCLAVAIPGSLFLVWASFLDRSSVWGQLILLRERNFIVIGCIHTVTVIKRPIHQLGFSVFSLLFWQPMVKQQAWSSRITWHSQLITLYKFPCLWGSCKWHYWNKCPYEIQFFLNMNQVWMVKFQCLISLRWI